MKNRFPKEMYNTTIGSLVVATYQQTIDNPSVRPNINKIICRWKKLVKNTDKEFSLDNFFNEVWSYFGFDTSLTPNLILIKSKVNQLFFTYSLNEDGGMVIYPLREDGVYPSTFYEPEDFEVVEWGEEERVIDVKETIEEDNTTVKED